MTDLGERFEVIVRDSVPSAPAPNGASAASATPGSGQAGFAGSESTISGFGLAVISGLADDVRISATGSGVSVRMTWPATLGADA